MKKNALDARNVIGRKLHHKRNRLPCKEFRLLQDNAVYNDQTNSCKIHHRCHPPCTAHQEAGDQSNDRKLGAAGNHRRGDHGHAAVFFTLNRPGRHDTGYAASGGDEERNKALAGEAESSENTIHDEGNTCHISTVLQNGQEQEYDGHLRNKADWRRKTSEDAVNHQRYQPVRCPCPFHERLYAGLNPRAKQGVICPVGHIGADGCDRNIINKEHHPGKNRQGEPPVRHNAVDFI